ncbi:hypothetical protein DN051_01420 [Streptomyces cadmiisoli]|uniref:Uncharacterized protein n=1 Tax=Streptomyces cadmiisoli TaxID=2184053 RepID=A0A2Z4IRN8_9ACTN|nr:hypothetical protein DN051_01420 [Streptomyces cadmiisoli]
MVAHADARLTFHGRCLVVRSVVADRRPVAHVVQRKSASPASAPIGE